MFHVDRSSTVASYSTTLMEEPWFSSPVWVSTKKRAPFGRFSMSALPHMANTTAVGLGRERPISGSDFFQSWPKWKHLVLIRVSGCDSCSGSCEDLAVACNAACGTRTKYTNISTVIMCQVKQAIEGSGWMCRGGSGWGWGAKQKLTVCYLDAGDSARPLTRQIRPTSLGLLSFLASVFTADLIVTVKTAHDRQLLPQLVPA